MTAAFQETRDHERGFRFPEPTSAGGHVLVALHDINDRVIEGFGINDCLPIFGDTLERTVIWKGSENLSKLAGKPVRLRFVLKDADLYSFQFRK